MARMFAYNLPNVLRKYRKLYAVSTFGAADCGVSLVLQRQKSPKRNLRPFCFAWILSMHAGVARKNEGGGGLGWSGIPVFRMACLLKGQLKWKEKGVLSAFSPGLLRKPFISQAGTGVPWYSDYLVYTRLWISPPHHKREEKYSLHFLSISNTAGKGGDLGQGGKEHFHELPACAGLLCSRPKQR